MVTCCVEGCYVTARSAKALCWAKYRMCFQHAIEHHPDEYVYNLKPERKTARRRALRGGHSTVLNSDKPNEEFMLAGIKVTVKN